jgi:DNA-binding IscR family transcriptional regulator
VIEQKVQPYRTVKLEFLAKEVNISTKEVRQLLSELILEGRIDACID